MKMYRIWCFIGKAILAWLLIAALLIVIRAMAIAVEAIIANGEAVVSVIDSPGRIVLMTIAAIILVGLHNNYTLKRRKKRGEYYEEDVPQDDADLDDRCVRIDEYAHGRRHAANRR